MKRVYSHPDRFTLVFTENALIATDDEGKCVSLPIGPAGLRDVPAKPLALADEMEVTG